MVANSVMKKWLEMGEERMGKLAQQLISNEKFVSAVQACVTKSLAAKETFDKSVRSALSAMNLPSTTDLEKLRTKVEALEQLLTSVEAKVDTLIASRQKPTP
jgi:polyhydroxyalkanoate synthesis regulator phasin